MNVLDEIEIALISIADGVNPAKAVQRAFDVINRERLRTLKSPVDKYVDRQVSEEITDELDRRALLHDSHGSRPILPEQRERVIAAIKPVLSRWL